jgi:hypothetical protein
MKATVCALSPSQDPYRSQIEGMLSTHVLPTFASAHGHLRAKAAWLAKEFAGVHFSDGRGKGALFNALLQAVIHSLSDRCVCRRCEHCEREVASFDQGVCQWLELCYYCYNTKTCASVMNTPQPLLLMTALI